MFFPFFMDWTIILVIIGVALSGIASSYIRSTYSKYDQYAASKGVTAAEVTQKILDIADLDQVRLEPVKGHLTDHYSSQEKVLRLSDATRNSGSVAAIGVAAHEAGHAMQDRDSYVPLRLRSWLVPITNFGARTALPILLFGFLLGGTTEFGSLLTSIGLILFSFTFIFQLVTLPVEFNASNRAMKVLEEQNILTSDELGGARKVLNAAALTYVAATIGSFLNLLRIFILFGGNRRRN